MKNDFSIKLDVHGKNESKEIALIVIEGILPQLEKYLNTKIDTLSGLSKKFMVKFANVKPLPFDNGNATLQNCYLEVKYNQLRLNISICLSGGKYENKTYYCEYFDNTYVLGNVTNDGVLTSIFNKDILIHDYLLKQRIDFDIEINKIKLYREMKQKLSDLNSSIQVNFE